MGKMIYGILGCTIYMGLFTVNSSAEMKNFSYKDGKVSYTLTQPDNVTIQVFTPSGTPVTTLFAGDQKEGEYYFGWTGRDTEGKTLEHGDYILKAGINRTLVKDAKFAKKGFMQFVDASDIVVDENGDLFILERGLLEKKDGKNTTQFVGPRGIYKFRGDGTPISNFAPSNSNFHVLDAGASGSWLALSDQHIFYGGTHRVNVHDKTDGQFLYYIGGWYPADGGREGTRGVYWAGSGGALGANNKLYVKMAGGQIKAFNRTLEKDKSWMYTGKGMPEAGFSPDLISDGTSKLYVLDNRTVSRFDDTGDDIVFRSKSPTQWKTKVTGGMALSKDMLYVASRAPASLIVQLWDNGEALTRVVSFDADGIVGLRDVAVSPNGQFLYLLEDGISVDDVEGKGRLFKYDLGYSQVLEQKLNFSQEPTKQ